MDTANEKLIQQMYDIFNRRDIPSALQLMQPDVEWPNGWEGGYVYGRAAVSEYWTRQWKEIDPHVQPVSIEQDPDGRIRVLVQQTVKDKQGQLLHEGRVTHIYTLEGGLVKHMEIQK